MVFSNPFAVLLYLRCDSSLLGSILGSWEGYRRDAWQVYGIQFHFHMDGSSIAQEGFYGLGQVGRYIDGHVCLNLIAKQFIEEQLLCMPVPCFGIGDNALDYSGKVLVLD